MPEELIAQYRLLHAQESDYGQSSVRMRAFLQRKIAGLRPSSVIDYGCGRSRLLDELKVSSIRIRERYDPAVPEHSVMPKAKFDLLLNTDVLEHIPLEELDAVITDFTHLSNNCLIVVDTKLARTILPNGQNAHCTVRPATWWLGVLRRYFPTIAAFPIPGKPSRVGFATWRTPLRRLPHVFVNDVTERLRRMRYRWVSRSRRTSKEA
jgi:hypothetical protein